MLPFAIYSYGTVEVEFSGQFHGLMRVPPFDQEAVRRQLQQRLHEIPGVSIADQALSQRPLFTLTLLRNESALLQFFKTMEWVVSEIDRARMAGARERSDM